MAGLLDPGFTFRVTTRIVDVAPLGRKICLFSSNEAAAALELTSPPGILDHCSGDWWPATLFDRGLLWRMTKGVLLSDSQKYPLLPAIFK